MVQDEATLKGKTIAVTRPCGQAEEAAEAIRKRGGKPYFIPTIEVKGPSDLAPIGKFIDELEKGRIDYIVFMSANGVRYLLSAAESLGKSEKLRVGLEKATVIAVGPRTAQELQASHIRVNLVPSKYTSEGVIETLQHHGVRGRLIRIPRTAAATHALAEKLADMGGLVEEVYVYESSVPVDDEVKTEFFRDLTAGRIDAVVFGSSMCVKNLFHMLTKQASEEKLRDLLNQKVTVVAIGPVTAETLRKMGVRVDVMPEAHLFEEALAALARHWSA
jgi:uroporphyrinogen-III synthase